MAVAREVSGTILSIKTFVTDDSFNGYFSDPGLASIFVHAEGAYIPVLQENLTVVLIPIDQISEIYYNFTGGTFILVNGKHIKGTALIEAIAGEGSLDRFRIPIGQISELKFNPQRVEQYVKTQTADAGYSYYDPQATDLTADVTLSSKNSFSLQRVALTVMHLGCDPNYIPCRPYTGIYTDWETDSIVVKKKILKNQAGKETAICLE